jgi:chemotaxis protein methyltransferase CheR
MPSLDKITDTEFSCFQRLLYDTAGIYLPPAKKILVAGRLDKRRRHYRFKSFIEYYRLVTSGNDSKEFQIMLDSLTTNETYFFREPSHFEFLGNELRSKRKHASNETIKIWSAACSSGEEVYSLAMVSAEILGTLPWKVMGSDINQAVLQHARKGHYSMDRTSGIDQELLHKYCLKGRRSQAGTFLVGDKLKQHTRFTQINLKNSLPCMGQFDSIFLRNVLIYFDSKTKKDVVSRIVSSLKPGGLFFISHSENLHGIDTRLKMIRPSVYRKI